MRTILIGILLLIAGCQDVATSVPAVKTYSSIEGDWTFDSPSVSGYFTIVSCPSSTCPLSQYRIVVGTMVNIKQTSTHAASSFMTATTELSTYNTDKYMLLYWNDGKGNLFSGITVTGLVISKSNNLMTGSAVKVSTNMYEITSNETITFTHQ